MSDDTQSRLRALPAVHELLARLSDEARSLGREVVVSAARSALGSAREAILAGGPLPDPDELCARVRDALRGAAPRALTPVINATGIIIHTGLGRSPMSDGARRAAFDAGGCVAVELDLESGQRGRRVDLVRDALRDLTGAQSATVVNNGAAALLICLATLAHGRRVLVSRGELVEIGGSFRLPEVIEAGGAHLREVGTTNRVHVEDFARAISPDTGAILRVHASNFRIEGFTREVELRDLARLASEHGLPLIHDIGSGLLRPSTLEPLRDEPDARSSIERGADLVLFSADKLLGGPQAGIIVGRADLIATIERHPLMRAVRVGKTILAALAGTLALQRDPALALEHLPALRMIALDVRTLRARGETLAQRLAQIPGLSLARVIDTLAYVGGGSNPARAIPSVGVAIAAAGVGEEELARRLRTGKPGIIGRIERGEVVLDMRTIPPGLDDELVRAVDAAV